MSCFYNSSFLAYWFSKSRSLNIAKYFGIISTRIRIYSSSFVSYSSQFSLFSTSTLSKLDIVLFSLDLVATLFFLDSLLELFL